MNPVLLLTSSWYYMLTEAAYASKIGHVQAEVQSLHPFFQFWLLYQETIEASSVDNHRE